MNKLFTILVILAAMNANAQWMPTSKRVEAKDFKNFSLYKSMNSSIPISNITSVTPKHSFDVLNYRLTLNIYNCFKTPYAKSFSADNEIKFKVDSTLNFIKLNANNNSIVIDSVKLVNNTSLSFTHISNLLTVNLNRVYNPGEIAEVIVFYRHLNVYDTAFKVNNGLVYTDCEPEGARKWFPCWDKPSDKATTDITVKVPSNVLLGSNGRLADSVRSADTIIYHWISRDPMATYLVAIAGNINYNLIIKYWHKPSNPLDSIPIRIYYNTGENPINVSDSIGFVADFFSNKFGVYPFEKIGFANGDNTAFGNMENQTLIEIFPNSWIVWVAGHEFSHHWFGDLITCGTWADLWLNEGFGTYCDALLIEHFHGYAAYIDEMTLYANQYFSSNSGIPIYNPAWITSTPPNYLLFSVLNYQKGSCVLYMLRNVLGDTMFFNVLKSHTTDVNFMYKNAVTDDFTTKINQVTGQDYTWFIDEWVKQRNHPKYSNTHGISNLGGGNWRVNFRTSQNLSYTPFHTMPIELKVMFHNGSDTVLKFMNTSNNQLFTYDFNKQPDSIKFDPDNKIILKEVTTTIGINKIDSDVPSSYSLKQNYPNPFNPVTNIKFDIILDSRFRGNGKVVLKVYDITGKEVETLVNEYLQASKYETQWNGSIYASGVYFYKLIVRHDGSSTDEFTDTKRMVLIK